MSKKIKIEIDAELYANMIKRYEKEKMSLVAININNETEFIEYILKNFDASSKQFETLTDHQKNAFNNIDLNNIDLNDLVKTLSENLGSSKEEESPHKNEKDKKTSKN